jgi:hypothetical protein
MGIIPKRLLAYTSVGALSAVGLFATVTHVQKPTSGQDRFMSEIEAVLAMTPSQKDQAHTAMLEARQSAQPIRQELTDTNKALQAAIRADDTAQVQRLSTTEGQEIGQLIGIRSSAVAKVYKTLTPDQKVRAQALQQVLMQGMRLPNEHTASRTAS